MPMANLLSTAAVAVLLLLLLLLWCVLTHSLIGQHFLRNLRLCHHLRKILVYCSRKQFWLSLLSGFLKFINRIELEVYAADL